MKRTGEPKEMTESEASIKPPTHCEICGVAMPGDICAYWKDTNGQGINSHISCYENEIDVYKVKSISANRHYFDTDISCIKDMVDESDYGDGYIITKERMPAGRYHTLPEFDGF